MRIHKGEKPFACDFEGCTKVFRTNETMRRHKLAHMGKLETDHHLPTVS